MEDVKEIIRTAALKANFSADLKSHFSADVDRTGSIGDKTMGIAQQTRFETTQRDVRNHDAMILTGYSVFAILLLIGLYLGSMSPGMAPGDFASMIVFP